MYPGCLGDQYIGLGAQTLVPKKHFSSFLLSVVLQQKYVEWKSIISKCIQFFQNSLEDNMQTGEKKR